MILRAAVVFLLFLVGTGGILFLDNLCRQDTGIGGNLVLNIEN